VRAWEVTRVPPIGIMTVVLGHGLFRGGSAVGTGDVRSEGPTAALTGGGAVMFVDAEPVATVGPVGALSGAIPAGTVAGRPSPPLRLRAQGPRRRGGGAQASPSNQTEGHRAATWTRFGPDG